MVTAGPFQMINHRFQVACPDLDLARNVAATLASVRSADGAAHSRYEVGAADEDGRREVSVDGRVVRHAGDAAGVIDGICTEANRLAIDSSTAPAVLHAGAVERDGRAVLIAGASGTGKSTLVTRMLGEGWRYLTDEGAQLTHHLTVLPYLKPIVAKRVVTQVGGSSVEVPRQHVDPATVGDVCQTETPVAGLVLLGIQPSTPGRMLVEACKLAFPVGRGRDCLDVLAQLVNRRPVIGLPARPDADAVAGAIAAVWDPAVGPSVGPSA